ncbi:conserved membrane protein of unknown function [Rhodovastum atsumiense]|uniref:Tyrosine-protein kinase G-rich domain-containing protein n=1 Tax=Rhodovastum atsumiense TaxID=504468 RepID=A0A5M6IKF3_9PROT|nr:XrtA system polysaccharide chain length determinant [Rhodovastum atsumiense]KAA5608662.1 hypothetical protein F1189_28045 [Rhodovastum atsumiense]CAH2598820.1 conserved membrane protein of unknown function [Rhodovastum atsumiense]
MSNIRALCYPYLTMAWRHRWWSVVLAWLICVLCWGAIMLIPSKYEVSARLYIDSDVVLTPLLKGIGLESAPANQIDMLHRTLLSRPNIETLIARTSLKSSVASPAAMQMLAYRLANEVKVVTPAKNLFSVTYSDSDPVRTYEVVNSLLAIFIESRSASSRNDIDGARRFLSEQIDIYAEKLKKAEVRKKEFYDSYADLLPDPAGGLSHLDTAIAQVASLKTQLADNRLKLVVLKKELMNTPSALSVAPDGARARPGPTVAASPDLTRAELNLEALRLRYTEQNPDVVRARELVARLRASGLGVNAVDTAARVIPNPTYERVKNDIVEAELAAALLTQRLAAMTQERDRLQAMSREKPNVLNDYVTIKREYEEAYNGHAELLRRYEAMRLTEAADSGGDKSKVKIVDPPVVPLNPIFPRRQMLATAALALGLCVGIGLPLVLKQFDRSFHSLMELEDLGLPIAGGISAINKPRPLLWRAVDVSALSFALLALVATNFVLILRVFEV